MSTRDCSGSGYFRSPVGGSGMAHLATRRVRCARCARWVAIDQDDRMEPHGPLLPDYEVIERQPSTWTWSDGERVTTPVRATVQIADRRVTKLRLPNGESVWVEKATGVVV